MNEPTTEIHLRDILGLLKRQIKLITISILIALGIATITVFALKPVYTASALILVDPSTKNLLDTRESPTNGTLDNARIDSEVELIRSHSSLLKVARDGQLLTDPEFGVKLSNRDKFLAFLRLSDGEAPNGEAAVHGVLRKIETSLDVRRKGLTSLISIDFSSQSPEKAAALANLVATSYIAGQLQAKIQGALSVRDILNSRIAEATAAIGNSENLLEEFVFQNLDRISTETGNTQISLLSNQLGTLEREKSVSENLAKLIDQSLQQNDWQSLSENLGLDAIAELETQRIELANRIKNTVVGTQTEIDLKKALESIENSIEAKASSELTRLRQETTKIFAQTVDLRKKIRVAAISSDLPSDFVTEIYQLQQNASISRNQYQTLLSRLREVETQVDLQVADSRVVSFALPPAIPSFPNSRLILIMAGLIGLGVGVGLAFLNEHYIGGFSSAEQIEAVLKKNVFGSVPRLKASTLANSASPSDVVLETPLSAYSESIRRIRAGIDQSLRRRNQATTAQGKPSKGFIVMVCSAVPGEGKTTTALSLARTYAQSGLKTLLVDTDMRRPSVHKLLSLAPKSGLFDYLSQKDMKTNPLPEMLTCDKNSSLQILLGAHSSGVPTDQLFTSNRFSQLLLSATNHYDIIILDTPPAGPVVDALYITPYIDFLAFVIKWASTSQNDARTSLSRLEESMPEHAEIAIVLNQQDSGKLDYLSNYESYYQTPIGS